MVAVVVNDSLAEDRIASSAAFLALVSGAVVDALDERVWLSHEANSADNVKSAITDALPAAKRCELFIQPPR